MAELFTSVKNFRKIEPHPKGIRFCVFLDIVVKCFQQCGRWLFSWVSSGVPVGQFARTGYLF